MQKAHLALFSAAILLLLNHRVEANPLFEGADPDIIVCRDRSQASYWIFPTAAGTTGESDFYAYSSNDLKSWQKHGPILDIKDIKWVSDDGAKNHQLWAPGIFQNNKKYYLYYSVGPQNPTPSRIGVATSTSPAGPFIDSGKPLITGNGNFEAIDAMVFADPKSKNIFLYCGGSAGSKLRVYQLNPDLISVKDEMTVPTPQNYTEGPFMHYHKGLYYLSYSHGRWNDSSYCLCYATATSALGPWTYRGKLIESDDRHSGPGHHAFFKKSESSDRDWYMVYHRWNNAALNHKMPSSRSVAIEKIEYTGDGLIKTIKMTD